jgi:hypothetical protein
MAEEYFYAGGFPRLMKRLNPRFAPFVTIPMALVINGLQLLLCYLAIRFEAVNLTFSMSLAALILINGLVHIGTCLTIRGYAPGVITGVALYLPISSYAFYRATSTGELSGYQIVIVIALGLLYQAVPFAYLLAASAFKQHSTQD